jgi:hypothetical protein
VCRRRRVPANGCMPAFRTRKKLNIADVKSTLPDIFSGLAQLSDKNVAALPATAVREVAYRAAVLAIRRNGRRRRTNPTGTHGQAGTLARPGSRSIAPTIARTSQWRP